MKLDILTATRAEYGLMQPLIARFIQDPEFETRLLVTGTHLSERFGMTYREIESDGIPIYKKIDILNDEPGVSGVSKTMANAMVAFTEHFCADKPDFLLVDGDRYETLSVCIAAVNCNVPIIHLSGGDTTEGAADEYYRHAISKMALLHFPTMDVYRNRVIQMGEAPERVFTVGSMSLEKIKKTQLLSLEQLEETLDFKLDMPFAVVTFHPVTLEDGTVLQQINELLSACAETADMKFIFTMANADNGGEIINQNLISFVKECDRALCVQSLGSLRYLSALNHCAFVLGNSSSGLIEAPAFHVPTINIGDRQKGRVKAECVIDCPPDKESILEAIQKARSKDFLESVCQTAENPYGDGNTSEKIVRHIKEYCAEHQSELKKKFYDISF